MKAAAQAAGARLMASTWHGKKSPRDTTGAVKHGTCEPEISVPESCSSPRAARDMMASMPTPCRKAFVGVPATKAAMLAPRAAPGVATQAETSNKALGRTTPSNAVPTLMLNAASSLTLAASEAKRRAIDHYAPVPASGVPTGMVPAAALPTPPTTTMASSGLLAGIPVSRRPSIRRAASDGEVSVDVVKRRSSSGDSCDDEILKSTHFPWPAPAPADKVDVRKVPDSVDGDPLVKSWWESSGAEAEFGATSGAEAQPCLI